MKRPSTLLPPRVVTIHRTEGPGPVTILRSVWLGDILLERTWTYLPNKIHVWTKYWHRNGSQWHTSHSVPLN